MMNEHEKNNLEEEYHFNQDDAELGSYESVQPQHSAEQAAEPVPNQPFSFSNIKKLIDKIKLKTILEAFNQSFSLRIGILVMVIVLIFLIYRCTENPIVKKVDEKVKDIPVSIITTQPQPQSQPLSLSTVSPAKPMPQPSLVTTSGTMNLAQFSRLEKDNAETQAQLKDVALQISNLRSNLDATTSSLKLVSEQLANLTSVIGHQATEIVHRKKHKPRHFNNQANNTMRIMLPAPKLQCALQAIIPGRAWLNCSNGETITVRQGTPIANYGEVSYIDATKGQVLTSSGKIITFSQEDS